MVAIKREISEETGLQVMCLQQLGATSFRYPWEFEQWHLNQHIAIFYRVRRTTGALATTVPNFEGQDSYGAVQVPLSQLTIDTASPLVLKAKQFLLNGERFDPTDTTYTTWKVLTHSVY